MKSFKYYLSIVLLAFSLASCKDNVQSSIPDFPVYLQLNLTAEFSTFKNSSGQFLVFEKPRTANERVGFGGIILCSGISLDDSGNSQYFAFDMACPYEAKTSIKVHPDSTGLPYVICEKCGSVFDVGLGYGNPLSGPAKDISKEFLKHYRTTIYGDRLTVER